jgi:cytochrome c peroxidase
MKTTANGTATRHSSRSGPRGLGQWLTALLVVSLVGVVCAPAATWAQNPAAPPSLKTIQVPEPDNLNQFVKSKPAAIALGKALFWDMQVGSDAVQSCATCHFNAGADIRSKNVVNPGLNGGDSTFQSVGPNATLDATLFPFTEFLSPDDRSSPMIRSWNDVVSSPGVLNTTYVGQPLSGAVEQGKAVPDPVFNAGGVNTRRVEPRNAPTVINAVFNFNNFWDGRADNIFNGSSPFGDADPDAGVWLPDGSGTLVKQRVRIPLSSLASQAVGPPGSPFEMSFAGRTFPDIGKKMLKLVPLGKQKVHPQDSVLGPLTQKRPGFKRVAKKGLNTTYVAMIQAAFQDQYWSSNQLVQPLPSPRNGEQFSQMEANFSLFFGLAVQLYEATLVSDDSPYDRFMEGDPSAMSASAQQGLNMFLSGNGDNGVVGGNCINCHGTSTFSNASVMHIGTTNFGASLPEGLIERMIMGDGGGSWYDSGYYDVSVRPIDEDLGRGGNTPFTVAGTPIPLAFIDRSMFVENGGTFPAPMQTLPLPCGGVGQQVCPQDQRVSTKGAFKVPTLRNIELTGPYMHNGGEASLMQVMDFYGRGGSFVETNITTFDPDVQVLCGLNPDPDPLFCGPINPATAEANQKKVIDFMVALTDERVRWEKAPFDHPELFIPNGTNARGADVLLKLPAIGAAGRAASALRPVGTFLGLHPYYPNVP